MDKKIKIDKRRDGIRVRSEDLQVTNCGAALCLWAARRQSAGSKTGGGRERDI